MNFIEDCMSKLPPKHAEVIRQIYMLGNDEYRAAKAMGCTESRLTYLHREALGMINNDLLREAE